MRLDGGHFFPETYSYCRQYAKIVRSLVLKTETRSYRSKFTEVRGKKYKKLLSFHGSIICKQQEKHKDPKIDVH